VKTHVSNILMKLGVADRTQAALWAVRHGITAEGEAADSAGHADSAGQAGGTRR
jgi:hypothetical protein